MNKNLNNLQSNKNKLPELFSRKHNMQLNQMITSIPDVKTELRKEIDLLKKIQD